MYIQEIEGYGGKEHANFDFRKNTEKGRPSERPFSLIFKHLSCA